VPARAKIAIAVTTCPGKETQPLLAESRAAEPAARAPPAGRALAHQRGTQRARRAPHRRRLVWHR
jgi:hypothetical protein